MVPVIDVTGNCPLVADNLLNTHFHRSQIKIKRGGEIDFKDFFLDLEKMFWVTRFYWMAWHQIYCSLVFQVGFYTYGRNK